MERIFLLGHKGKVGRSCLEEFNLQKSSLPFSLSVLEPEGGGHISESNMSSLQAKIEQERPRVLINAVSCTDSVFADKHHRETYFINATVPGYLAEVCQKNNVLLIHYSTDYVYSGSLPLNQAYNEQDFPGPKNVYGCSKWEGDMTVLSKSSMAIILRTSWVFSAHGVSFVSKILEKAKSKQSFKVVNDQVGSPTSAYFIARTSMELAKRSVLSKAFPSGVFHLTNTGATTRAEFAQAIISEGVKIGLLASDLDSSIVEEVSSEQWGSSILRPQNSQMNGKKFDDTFGLNRPSWRDELVDVLKRMKGHTNF